MNSFRNNGTLGSRHNTIKLTHLQDKGYIIVTSTTLLCTCTSTIHPWHHRNCEALTHKEGITEQLKKGAVDELQSSMWIFWMNHYFFSKGSTHFYYCSVFKLPAVKILVNGNMFRYTTWKVWIGEFKYSNSCLLSEKKLWNWIILFFQDRYYCRKISS